MKVTYNKNSESLGWIIPYIFGILFVAMVAGYIIFMSTTQSFYAKCSKAYDPDTAKHELCVDRMRNGGPLHEENIGKI